MSTTAGPRPWLTTLYVCAALLVVPVVGIVVMLVGPGSTSAQPSDGESVRVVGDGPAGAGSSKLRVSASAPPNVRRCCATLTRASRTGELDHRPALADAAKICVEESKGANAETALDRVASALGGQSIPVPAECTK